MRHLGSVLICSPTIPSILFLGGGTEFYPRARAAGGQYRGGHLNAARKFAALAARIHALVFTAAWRLFRSGDSEKRAVAAP